jgi:aminoglycoside phosphotransferase
MNCCDLGCYYCAGAHTGECCRGQACGGPRIVEKSQEQLAQEAAQKLLQTVTAVALSLQAAKERQKENAQEELRRLAHQQEEEQLAAETNKMIEARLARLRQRQRQPEAEPVDLPREQRPRVVRVKAAKADSHHNNQKVFHQ